MTTKGGHRHHPSILLRCPSTDDAYIRARVMLETMLHGCPPGGSVVGPGAEREKAPFARGASWGLLMPTGPQAHQTRLHSLAVARVLIMMRLGLKRPRCASSLGGDETRE